MIYLPIFPTIVSSHQMSKKFDVEEINFINSLPTRKNQFNFNSVDQYVLNNDAMRDIKKEVEAQLEKYIEHVYSPVDKLSLRITQSWCNFSNEGDSHHRHMHPNSFVSGVLYLQCNKNDSIVFLHPKSSNLIIYSKHNKPWNSNMWRMPVKEGTLILFPSELVHEVDSVVGDKTRISLSFNTFPVGRLGSEDNADELILS